MKIKEYLDTEKGYVLVKDTCKRSEDWIEVPDDAELYAKSKESSYAFFAKNNGETLSTFSSFHKNEWHKESTLRIENIHINYDILWQCPQQPESLPFIDDEVQSINDQYAEIENVRQAVRANSGSGVDATLKERQASYGCFEDVAFVTQGIIELMNRCNYKNMPQPHKMALYMIASKMARLVNGDFNHLDSWHDIGGYAKLIEDLVKENKNG